MLAHPLSHVLVLRVAAIAPGSEKRRVAAYSAHIFRGTSALPIQAPGVCFVPGYSLDLLYRDNMFPAIPKVVLIDKRCAFCWSNLSQAHQSIILVEIIIFWTRFTIVRAFIFAR